MYGNELSQYLQQLPNMEVPCLLAVWVIVAIGRGILYFYF